MASMGVKLQINSADMEIAKRILRKMPRKMRGKVGRDALKKGSKVYINQYLKPALDKRDHTLSELAGLGYPYARKGGSINIHNKTPWVVHRRSGAVYNSIRSEAMDGLRGPSVRIYSDFDAAPHVRYVFQGTRNMLPRDPFKPTGKAARTDVEFAVLNHIMDEMDKL